MPKPNPKCDEESALGAARGDDDLFLQLQASNGGSSKSSMAFCLSQDPKIVDLCRLRAGAPS